jgi:hypothetical protein
LLLPLGLAGGGSGALAQPVRLSLAAPPQAVVGVVFRCGTYDGRFQCRQDSGGPAMGKNATPGASTEPSPEPPGTWTALPGEAPPGAPPVPGQEVVGPGEHSCPPGYKVLAVPTAFGYCEPAGTPAAAAAGCQNGMVGTPPDCHCPQNSELLGGNCVHYAAICQNGLAADYSPQPCAGVEEKLACKLRQDGLKDCCCLTYDKL